MQCCSSEVVATLWHELRASRADGLAIEYGAAASTDDVSLADRCTGLMREDYNRSHDPRKAGLPPKTYAFVAPKVCALGVARGLVESDGTMSEQAGNELMIAVIEGIGAARFQTRVFNERAVSEYHLAGAGQVTRREHCVAMGCSGWDAQPSKQDLPPRELFFKAVRNACAAGVERGLVAASGAPVINRLSR